MEVEILQWSDRFEVASQDIVHETIEGEVVIVNLENGFYYSTDKAGCQIWNMLLGGFSVGEIVQSLRDRFPQQADEISTPTTSMINDLFGERLIKVSKDAQGPEAGQPPEVEIGDEFVPPALAKHREMQDLLLVDPIHVVADSG